MKLNIVALVRLGCFVCLFTVVRSHILKDGRCPLPEFIEPCTCSGGYLSCMNVDVVNTLKKVFSNSAGYSYNQVNISFSSLIYLPHEVFEKTSVGDLILHNVVTAELFDSPPSGLKSLDKLQIENSYSTRGISWNLLHHMSSLRILNIYHSTIKTLDEKFSQFVPKSLQQLTLHSTKTRSIKPGALAEFVNLNRVAVDSGELTTLSRDIFPRPFNVMALYFNDNKISSIPQDLFADMPRLRTLSMKNNLLSTFPQSALGNVFRSSAHVKFEGNPLKCDCLMRWLIKEKPVVLGGSCASPKHLHGKQLGDLATWDFQC